MVELLYPKSTFVPIPLSNTSGVIDLPNVRLFVVHIAQSSTQSGVSAWFNDPASNVSAHFSVGRNGVVRQYCRLDVAASAEEDYNDVAISIEHVGYSGQRLTRRQLKSSLMLLAWLHGELPAVALRRTANPAGRGVIGHGELGLKGGDHPDCPGSAVLGQFDAAYRRR